jgi:hypothetical protein
LYRNFHLSTKGTKGHENYFRKYFCSFVVFVNFVDNLIVQEFAFLEVSGFGFQEGVGFQVPGASDWARLNTER